MEAASETGITGAFMKHGSQSRDILTAHSGVYSVGGEKKIYLP